MDRPVAFDFMANPLASLIPAPAFVDRSFGPDTCSACVLPNRRGSRDPCLRIHHCEGSSSRSWGRNLPLLCVSLRSYPATSRASPSASHPHPSGSWYVPPLNRPRPCSFCSCPVCTSLEVSRPRLFVPVLVLVLALLLGWTGTHLPGFPSCSLRGFSSIGTGWITGEGDWDGAVESEMERLGSGIERGGGGERLGMILRSKMKAGCDMGTRRS